MTHTINETYKETMSKEATRITMNALVEYIMKDDNGEDESIDIAKKILSIVVEYLQDGIVQDGEKNEK